MYVISYEIYSDKLRNKVAKVLEGYGVRIQYSVFECRINEKKCKELYGKLMKLTQDMTEGSICFYFICGKCEGKIRTIGHITTKYEKILEDIIVV